MSQSQKFLTIATAPAPTAFTAAGFGDANTNGEYIQIGSFDGSPNFVNRNGLRWCTFNSFVGAAYHFYTANSQGGDSLYLNDGSAPPGSSWTVDDGADPAGTTT